MKIKTKQTGLSLMEEVVVVAAIALLIIFGLPAVRALFRSFEAKGGAKAMISAALSTARAVAAQQQHYAGIRFQNKYQQDSKGCQYMIFIVHDPDKTKLANGFRAVEGYEPIKLPDSVGVMEVVNGDNEINQDGELIDKTSFSIVFSPSGKLVIHYFRMCNKDGRTSTTSKDDIFNTKSQVQKGIGMFVQDNDAVTGLQEEQSRNSFIIYDRTIFEKLNPNSRYTDYLQDLVTNNKEIYINPYTGTMIEK